MRLLIPPADCPGVYLIQDGDLYKIGFASHIRSRVSQIRCGKGRGTRAYPSAILHSWLPLPDRWLRAVENRLHDRLSGREAWERSWEWFTLSARAVRLVQVEMIRAARWIEEL